MTDVNAAAPSKSFFAHIDAPHVVATVVTIGFITFLIVLAFKVVTETTLMVTMAGVLGSKFGSVVDYYLGSSVGQKNTPSAQLPNSSPQ